SAGGAAARARPAPGPGLPAPCPPGARPTARPAGVTSRRHGWAAAAGLYAQLSLGGVPGTPGSLLWFAVARDAVRSAPVWLAVALIGAWVAAFVSGVQHVRAAVGIRSADPPPPAPVPLPARLPPSVSRPPP